MRSLFQPHADPKIRISGIWGLERLSKPKLIDGAVKDISLITSQKPTVKSAQVHCDVQIAGGCRLVSQLLYVVSAYEFLTA